MYDNEFDSRCIQRNWIFSHPDVSTEFVLFLDEDESFQLKLVERLGSW